MKEDEMEQDLAKEVCVITNGNVKSGVELADYFTSKGATVLLGVEHYHEGRLLAEQLNERNPLGQCVALEYKRNSLSDVRSFAKKIQERHTNISLLIHNGTIKNSHSTQTVDGFETFLGVNYLSVFALTGLLAGNLFNSNSRIITVLPPIKLPKKLEFHHFRNPKNKKKQYIQSIVASMFFAKKLDERMRANQLSSRSILCYVEGEEKFLKELQPVIFCATSSNVKSGDEIGYDKKHQGGIANLSIIQDKYNSILADNLWKLSEAFVDVHFPFQ